MRFFRGRMEVAWFGIIDLYSQNWHTFTCTALIIFIGVPPTINRGGEDMTDGRRLNLGVVQQLEAESFGDPGQRTFRLRATTSSGGVDLWLEKEQIVALGAAVE